MIELDQEQINKDVAKLVEFTKEYQREYGDLVQADFLDFIDTKGDEDKDASPFLVHDYLDGWYIAGDDARQELQDQLDDLDDTDDDDEREQIEDVIDDIDPFALVEYSTVDGHCSPALLRTKDIIDWANTYKKE